MIFWRILRRGLLRLNLCLLLVRGKVNDMCLRFMSLKHVMVHLVLLLNSSLRIMLVVLIWRHLNGIMLLMRQVDLGLHY